MLLGRYQVRRLIKRGGFAEVFEAVALGDKGFERKVAIKRLLPELAHEQSIRRTFFDEARIVARLSHPNIVGILDFGLVDDLPFQVLDLVEGSDLGTLAARPMPAVLAVHVVAEVARALDYAHAVTDDAGQRLGIVHRDVTPQNILLSWAGDVRLADFGIARARQRLEETQLGVVKGTLAYMAPEQAQGSIVDRRADIYSLGCVLHRLIAGRSPLDDAVARTKAIAGAAIDLDASLSADVVSIVRRAIRARAEDRYPDAGAMADACWAFISKNADRDLRPRLREWISAQRRPEEALVHPTELAFELSLEGSDPELEVKQFTTVLVPIEQDDLARTVTVPEATVIPTDVGSGSSSLPLALLASGALLLTLALSFAAGRVPEPALPIAIPPAAIETLEPSVSPRAGEVEPVEPPPVLRPSRPDQPRKTGVDDTRGRLSRFRASPSERTLDPSLATMPDLESAPPALERRFRRTLQSLKSSRDRISRSELAALEARYFRLRERFDGLPSADERRTLLRDLRLLERELDGR